MSFYRETFKEARKPHICSECGGLIEAKEHYWDIAGMSWEDNDFFWLRMCIECLAEHIRVRMPGEPMYFTQLHEGENPDDPDRAHWFQMRARRRSRRQEWLAQKKAANGNA